MSGADLLERALARRSAGAFDDARRVAGEALTALEDSKVPRVCRSWELYDGDDPAQPRLLPSDKPPAVALIEEPIRIARQPSGQIAGRPPVIRAGIARPESATRRGMMPVLCSSVRP